MTTFRVCEEYKGKIITGVAIPANRETVLPVIIRLEEAFVGQAKTRFPAQGTYALGKAFADKKTGRVHIHIDGIQITLPDGQSYLYEGNIGYVREGSIGTPLGIKGDAVWLSPTAIAMTYVSNFAAGAAELFMKTGVSEDGKPNTAHKNPEHLGALCLDDLVSLVPDIKNKVKLREDNPVSCVRIREEAELHIHFLKGVTLENLRYTACDAFYSYKKETEEAEKETVV